MIYRKTFHIKPTTFSFLKSNMILESKPISIIFIVYRMFCQSPLLFFLDTRHYMFYYYIIRISQVSLTCKSIIVDMDSDQTNNSIEILGRIRVKVNLPQKH